MYSIAAARHQGAFAYHWWQIDPGIHETRIHSPAFREENPQQDRKGTDQGNSLEKITGRQISQEEQGEREHKVRNHR